MFWSNIIHLYITHLSFSEVSISTFFKIVVSSYQIAWHHIPEDYRFHRRCHVHSKYQIGSVFGSYVHPCQLRYRVYFEHVKFMGTLNSVRMLCLKALVAGALTASRIIIIGNYMLRRPKHSTIEVVVPKEEEEEGCGFHR